MIMNGAHDQWQTCSAAAARERSSGNSTRAVRHPAMGSVLAFLAPTAMVTSAMRFGVASPTMGRCAERAAVSGESADGEIVTMVVDAELADTVAGTEVEVDEEEEWEKVGADAEAGR